MVLHQEAPDGTERTVTLEAGQYAINEPGVWHTADIEKGLRTARKLMRGEVYVPASAWPQMAEAAE